jgi:hypothetical protein
MQDPKQDPDPDLDPKQSEKSDPDPNKNHFRRATLIYVLTFILDQSPLT